MKRDKPKTPLLALLRELTIAEQTLLAEWAKTSRTYLYTLAGCGRGSCRAQLAAQIEEASKRMRERTNGVSRIVTQQEIATMCEDC